MPKFYDLQTGDYSHHDTIDGLFLQIKEQYCECGEGYDILDEKDNKMKCLNCKDINNIESLSEEYKTQEIEGAEYRIEEGSPDEDDEILPVDYFDIGYEEE